MEPEFANVDHATPRDILERVPRTIVDVHEALKFQINHWRRHAVPVQARTEFRAFMAYWRREQHQNHPDLAVDDAFVENVVALVWKERHQLAPAPRRIRMTIQDDSSQDDSSSDEFSYSHSH